MKLIKLDWDSISFELMLKRVEEIKLYGWCKQIEVFSSPSMDGYHVEIESFWELEDKVIFNLRYILKDDLNRLVKDMLDPEHSETRNLLFESKEKSKAGMRMRFERMTMFIYYRQLPTSEYVRKSTTD